MKSVFLTGSYDLFHAGHAKFIQHAAALGDCVDIGISSDAHLRRNKGENRPIYDYETRASILRSLKGVRAVYRLHGETNQQIARSIEDYIRRLKPDIVCCGWEGTADPFVIPLEKKYGFIYCKIYAEVMHTSDTIKRISEVSHHDDRDRITSRKDG